MRFDLVNFCFRCKRYWACDSRRQQRCLVNHGPGECCHYGWTEVRVESVPIESEVSAQT